MKKYLLLKIFGKVQGVFFRQSAKKTANVLEITGWIKNVSDGTVACFVSGEEEQVNSFVIWCQKGPDSAGVENVEIIQGKPKDLIGFQIVG